MKWSGFLIGGIAGMAAAAYVAKKRPGMFAWASSAAGEAWTGMRGRALNAVINRKFNHAAEKTVPKHSDLSKEHSTDAWGQITMLMNSDPEVKKEAEQIAAEAKTH
ncbi:hypothetical protein ACFPYJ_17355 [Paenibacillus solisilvae]|uniref:YtxH domain-containing protein n=1 Tax=Paenibacillus solisilvae TaxID=2486751 RepID=A0ABW0W2B1_9BACL